VDSKGKEKKEKKRARLTLIGNTFLFYDNMLIKEKDMRERRDKLVFFPLIQMN
jgi:hypothetical protein